MPQFDFYSFSGQTFYFLTFYYFFYFFSLYFYIPFLSEVIKLRKKLNFISFLDSKQKLNFNNQNRNLFDSFYIIL